MTPKRLSLALATAAVGALLVVGLLQLGSTPTSTPSTLTLAQMRSSLEGSPPELASLHTQASELLGGGLPALRARLASLHGTPVVINKWPPGAPPVARSSGPFSASLSRAGAKS